MTETAIVGYGDVKSTHDDLEAPMTLAVEAVRTAIRDASISKDEIDGVLTGRRPISDRQPQWNNILANYLNIRPTYSSEITSHGAGVGGTLKHATAAIAGGFAETILCVASDSPAHTNDMVEAAGEGLDADPEFEAPYGHFIPGLYAMIAQRYLHKYDVTREDMAQVAVEARKWGTRHPDAYMYEEGEITVSDVLSSRKVATPLNLLDCAPWDERGTGGACIVTTADRAEDLHEDPIYISGMGEYNTHEYLTGKLEYEKVQENEPTLTTHGTREAARQAYERAEMTPDDIDLVESHDNFTHIGLIGLEDMGFCEKGEAGKFVRDGGIDFDGGLPLNTNGGCLSYGQSGIQMDWLTEAIRQLRGEAKGVQVTDAEAAMVRFGGGMGFACNTVTILSTRRA